MNADGTIPTAHIFRHRTFTPAEVSRGREMALDAWQANQDAEAWNLDRSLDPAADNTDLPSWSAASVLTVADAEQALSWVAGHKL